LARSNRGIQRLRRGARAIGGDIGECVQDRIVLRDPRERSFGDGERRDFLRGNRLGDVGRRAPIAFGLVMTGSSCIDAGRFGFIWQRKFVDHFSHFQRHREIGTDGRLPRVFNRQSQRPGDSVDIVIKRFGHGPSLDHSYQ
jgi:hypothetical protein